MPDKNKLEILLSDRGLKLTGPVVISQNGETAYLAFVQAIFSNDGKRVPSSYALNGITKDAKSEGFDVTFVVVDSGDRRDIDSSLKTMLLGKHLDQVRNSFASFTKRDVDVWIEPKKKLSEDETVIISRNVKRFFELLDYEVKSVFLTQTENIPSKTAILRTLRTHAPCSIQDLSVALVRKEFTVPNEVWMNHALDKLRKSGAMVRQKNGEYFLSLSGLSSLGTQKNNMSPDIVRALAFAKREA